MCDRHILLFLLTIINSAVVAFPHFSYIGSETPSASLSSDLIPPIHNRHWTLENVTRLHDTTDEVNIAYFVQISESTIPMIQRLLNRIHHPENFYALHFDRKIPPYKVIKLIASIKANSLYSNVHIMERESITYRGITMVLNNMAAITDLLNLGDWEYFINISGSDYPLISAALQRKLLALPYVQERASNFFIISPEDQWEDTKRYRFEPLAIDTALGMSNDVEDSNLVILNEHTPLADKLHYQFVKGEGWFILTRNACRFMLESSYARKMLLSMAFSQDASEHYYVSLFWNHPEFNRTIVPHALRTVYWKINGVSSGQHPYVIDQLKEENGSYTAWRWLRKSPHFFARKFGEADSPLMDMIDDQMSGLGENVDSAAVDSSALRAEQYLHWLFGIKPEKESEQHSNIEQDLWPSRR